MKPDGRDIKSEVIGMYTDDGARVDSCPHPGEMIHLEMSVKPELYDILRSC